MVENSERQKALIESYLDCKNRLSEIDPNSATGQETIRELWGIIDDYLESKVISEFGESLLPATPPEIPTQMLMDIWHLVATAVTGKTPKVISVLKHKGTPGAPPLERQAIRQACLYVAACKAGIISNSAHTKTVAEAYGVNTETVRGWVKRFPVDASKFHPDWGAQRETIITNRMNRAGARYKISGRSHKAISARADPNANT